MWYLVSNSIELIIIIILTYLPMAAVIVGVVSFVCFLIFKHNNKKYHIIFLTLSTICLAIVIMVFLFFMIGGMIGFGPID